MAVALNAAFGDLIKELVVEANNPPPVVLLPVSLMLSVQPSALFVHDIELETLGVDVWITPVKVPKLVAVALLAQLINVATVALTTTAEDVAALVNSGDIPLPIKSLNHVKITSKKTTPMADQKPISFLSADDFNII